MLPSVTMSSPASTWSAMTARTASANASAWRHSLNACRTSRPASCWVNHAGRGYEPTIVVGSSGSAGAAAPAVSMVMVLLCHQSRQGHGWPGANHPSELIVEAHLGVLAQQVALAD